MEGRDGRRVSAFSSVFWISLGGALGGGILHCLVRGKGREGGGRGGKKGGRLERKGYRVGGENRKRKTEGRRENRKDGDWGRNRGGKRKNQNK